MPPDKELINALGKPIVGKLKEKLAKCRTEKGKTVSRLMRCFLNGGEDCSTGTCGELRGNVVR
jgi:hypothetical protein